MAENKTIQVVRDFVLFCQRKKNCGKNMKNKNTITETTKKAKKERAYHNVDFTRSTL